MEERLKQAIQSYDKIAEIYAKHTYEKVVQYQINQFISMLNGKKVLDVGCASGRDVEYLKEENLDVTGIDLSENLIKEAKKRVKGKLKVMDFMDTKFKDGSFDGIWSMCATVHQPKEDLVKSLIEFKRILKTGGVLYLSVEEGQGEYVEKKSKYGNEPRIFFRYGKKETEKILRENGFEVSNSSVTDVLGKSYVEIFAKKS